MVQIMGIVNLTPDSFVPSSRSAADEALPRIMQMAVQGAGIVDLGAVSTRPGASLPDVGEEWRRLEPVLRQISSCSEKLPAISIDTFRSEIVRRAFDTIGPFIVNDISAGEDDCDMLETVGKLGLDYIAMHKRGNPSTMDSLCEYEDIISELLAYFVDFALKAEDAGITDWIMDPGLGFAKTTEQNWEILGQLDKLSASGRRILIGAADKRFTGGQTEKAHMLALKGGADILRVHDVAAAAATIKDFNRQ